MDQKPRGKPRWRDLILGLIERVLDPWQEWAGSAGRASVRSGLRHPGRTCGWILLTGTTGQVGGSICGPLANLGEVISVNRTQLDLSRPETIADSLDQLKPDLVVNPAAYTAGGRAENERSLAFRVNAEAPWAIAVWTARYNVPLIQFSTDYVFDGSGERPWCEDDVPAPLSTYGESKLVKPPSVLPTVRI
jgi:dTDP-4-dehydrorhamnose reductase